MATTNGVGHPPTVAKTPSTRQRAHTATNYSMARVSSLHLTLLPTPSSHFTRSTWAHKMDSPMASALSPSAQRRPRLGGCSAAAREQPTVAPTSCARAHLRRSGSFPALSHATRCCCMKLLSLDEPAAKASAKQRGPHFAGWTYRGARPNAHVPSILHYDIKESK